MHNPECLTVPLSRQFQSAVEIYSGSEEFKGDYISFSIGRSDQTMHFSSLSLANMMWLAWSGTVSFRSMEKSHWECLKH